MAKSMNIIGAAEFKKALRDNATLDDVKKIVQMNASEITSEAQWKAPLDTGTLERSIVMTTKDNGLTSTVSVGAEYGSYVEFGTRYMAAQPFIGPTYKKQVKKFKHDMERLVK